MASLCRNTLSAFATRPLQQGCVRTVLVRCLSTAAPSEGETVSGWFPPKGGNVALQFHVGRTHTNNLPLYRKATRDGHRVQTKVKHLTGDLRLAAEALSKVTGVSQDKMQIKFSEIVLPGDHFRTIEAWLKEHKF
eukprot:comp19306_c0_seq1/m.22170 comp19306_c0_seq1/g.22170  ORF comp19306_c0_seq1/g.22170 comp19306_c0_seq1/m.22170 type:complete len:135 (-) comp19306_c0_seq1:217-621(-)